MNLEEAKAIVDMDFENKNLLTAIHEAIGAGSACWENLEGAGVFQSDRAQAVGVQLLAAIRTYFPSSGESFEQELTSLINRYSMENDSGTPDFILAAYLEGCLKNFNETIQHRSNWRGESTELPALAGLQEASDG